MPITNLTQLLNEDLVAAIENVAFRYSMEAFALPNRVTLFNDASGMNPRKFNTYLPPRSAQELQEATDIPTYNIRRHRTTQIEISEYGDRYPITDRRIFTDTESIVADAVQSLGFALGQRKEQNLWRTAGGFTGGTFGSDTTDYNFAIMAQVQAYLMQRSMGDAQAFHIIHPYQEMVVKEQLVNLSTAAVPEFRNSMIRAWRYQGFGNVEVVISPYVPRRVTKRLNFQSATGGTFKLQIGTERIDGRNVTANISYSGTPATLVSNIKTALEALTYPSNGTWTVTGTSVDNISVTSPMYLDATQELRVAVDDDGYDIVNLTGTGASLTITEVSAVARSIYYLRDAIALDMRQTPQLYQELVNNGRTLELSLYEKYGTGLVKPERGFFVITKANPPAVS